MPKISRRCGHLFIYLFIYLLIRTLFSYNIVVSCACAATHKNYLGARPSTTQAREIRDDIKDYFFEEASVDFGGKMTE